MKLIQIVIMMVAILMLGCDAPDTEGATRQTKFDIARAEACLAHNVEFRDQLRVNLAGYELAPGGDSRYHQFIESKKTELRYHERSIRKLEGRILLLKSRLGDICKLS